MDLKPFMPVIKWNGSKRKVSKELHYLWANKSKKATYFEPFVGGGAMLPKRPCQQAIAGDIIEPLIDLWKEIKTNPDYIANYYETIWKEREKKGAEVYYNIRNKFNKNKKPEDFMVLSRMCINGLIRFNKKGEFNTSLHHSRSGIQPKKLRTLLYKWSNCLKEVNFLKGDYEKTLETVNPGDFVFLDPPYMNTKGMYTKEYFDYDRFWNVLELLNSKEVFWILTLDGKAGKRQYHKQGDVPKELYRNVLTVSSGNSPFTRLKSSLDKIIELVYINFDN